MGDVTLDGITKRYDDVVAVDDVNIHIEDGEFVTLVGPSGCGKSTTLEIVAGLTNPSGGTVTIADRDVTRLPPKDRDISMVFQNIALFPHMNVRKNISFGLRLRDFDSEETERRVQRAAEILQLEGMLDRMPDELSGGQQQRVGIGRAIVREPEVFLMDEPLANLDAKLRVHMRTELQRLHDELETTILYVTHDQAEAMTMSDRIAVLNHGELQQFAPPLVCYNEPANEFVAGFIGSPSMNFLEGEMGGERVETPHFSVGVDPAAVDVGADGPVTVGIRPEDIYLRQTAATVEQPTDAVEATVDVLEPMGDEIFVYLLLGDAADDGGPTVEGADEASARSDQLLMSVEPDVRLESGERVEVVLDRDRVHLFDTGGDARAHGVAEGSEAPTEVNADGGEGR
ncbi:ABC transporter ATP-binding protein [Candidatus Halobonum tyrrellensis]|uniref:ABC-type D-xylose/L-arabinose transporter n=1 Tax=Candidatus Halobonum tyrrellensis G22 TaxID=1324957 RepID=V4GUB0_9EURY|nr:ABC transporter ATP-binding protein [Candidatus Halobonum tyrrellensis]ESP88721.1 glycerol-3-phosphate-transporting ATPase [Candidatus Halobonum tyrrellensis G22]